MSTIFKGCGDLNVHVSTRRSLSMRYSCNIHITESKKLLKTLLKVHLASQIHSTQFLRDLSSMHVIFHRETNEMMERKDTH